MASAAAAPKQEPGTASCEEEFEPCEGWSGLQPEATMVLRHARPGPLRLTPDDLRGRSPAEHSVLWKVGLT